MSASQTTSSASHITSSASQTTSSSSASAFSFLPEANAEKAPEKVQGTKKGHKTDMAESSGFTAQASPSQSSGECRGQEVECPEHPDMHKSDGVEGGFNLRHRQSPHDTGSTADSSMKHGQMSPACPTTPDKNMSQGGTPDPSASNSANKHSKRESYKVFKLFVITTEAFVPAFGGDAQKKTYRSQKKEAAKELLSTITDPAVVLLGDWLKVRGTLKSWTKLWCVLKPGVLVLYKSDKHKGSQWVGTILLNTCQLLERPSKKDGFCFKLFHPLDQSIWATKGPKGETIGAFVQPLPYSYCIFRAPSESAGKCWMDALELALKCTNLLKRSMTRLDNTSDALVEQDLDRSRHQDISWHPPSQSEDYHCSQNGSDHLPDGESDAFGPSYNSMRAQERSMNESDLERHFANQGAIRREGSFPGLAEEEKVCSQHKGTKGLSFDMSKKCDISQARRPLPPHEKAREESPCLTVGHSLIPRANEFCKTSETYKPPSGEPLWNQVKSECASVRNLQGQVNSQTVFENQSVHVKTSPGLRKMPFSPKQKLCGTPLRIHQSSSRLAASKSAADQMHIPPVAKIKLYGNDNDQAKGNITFRPKNMRIEADRQDSLSESLLLPAAESGGPSGWICSKNEVADCVVSNGSKLRIGDSVQVESTSFNTVCELPKQEQVSSGGLSNALMAERCGDVNEATQTTFDGEKNEISTCSFESRILDQQSTCSLFLFINHPLSSRSDPDHTVSSDVCRSTFPYRSEACQNKVSPCECRRLTVRNSNPDGGKTRIICTGCSQHDDTYTEPQTIKCRNQSNSSEEENSHSGSHSCLIYSDNKRKPEWKSTAKADVQEQIGNRDTNPRTWINSERTSQSNNGDALKSFDTKVKMDCRSSDIAVKCNADDKKWKRIDCSNTISSALAESKSQSGCDDWTFIQEGLNLPSEADSASSDVTALCSPDISELSSKSLWASSLDLNESASSVDRNRSAHDRLSFRNRSLSRGSTLTSRTSSTSSGSQLHRHQKAHSSARGKKSAKGQGESAKYKKEGGGKGKGGGKKKDKAAEGGAADAKGEADDKKKKKKDKGGDKGDEAGDKKKKKKKGDEGKEEGDKAEEGGEGGKDKKKKKKKSDAGKAEGDKAEEGEEGGKDKKKKKKKSDAGKAEEGDAGEEDKKKKKKKKSKGEGEEESPAESDEGGKKKKKKKDKEKEGGAEPDTEVQESSQEISGILKTPSDTSMKEAGDISSEESGKEKEIEPSTGAEEAPEIKLEDVPQAVPISKPPSVSETTQTEEPEIAQAAAGGGFPPVAAGAAAAGYRDQSPFTPLSSASEPGSFGRYPYKRDDIVGRTTSTSENDDRVYEMPFCLGKDTWYQKEGPGLPHCQHHTEITKLCPKCLATLRNKDIYGTYSPQGDQQGERPLFVSQRYKVAPVQDPQLIYQDREGPGMVIDDRGPDYTSQVPQSEFEGSPGAFRPMASGTAAPPYSSMAESGQYQKPYQPPGKKDRPGGRPTAEELNYALLALKIRKTRIETQKIELVKENLLLDLFMKEEKLNKEYGTDRWRRYLRSVPGSGKNPASSDERQESQENLFASWGGQNESQNRQNSAMSLPHSDFQAGLKNSQLDDGSRAVLVACDQRIGSHSEDEGLNCNENGQVKWPGGLGFESLAYLYQLKQEYEYPCMSSLAGSEIMEEPRDRTRLTTDIPTDTNIAQMKPDIRHSQVIQKDKQNQEAAGKMEGELIKSRKNGRVKKNWSFSFRGLDEDKSDREDSETSQSEFEEDGLPGHMVIAPPEETNYIINQKEDLGQSGDDCQTEEVTDENKSLIWTLVKQVRPGMDLSKVVLPTFILEPRSFLDKLSDYYYHADILSGAVLEESPYSRMKSVVRWYLSGFYKKPKGLKKPYNPVIGEAFRCCWRHPVTGSRTFYIAEQVSHHPPISVFHVTNRKDGFNISGSILARSKFYGNSLSAILDGVALLSFLERGEDYFITMPYAHCKGILIGTLTMELGGKVTINCPKTGYKCELEFKLKPFLGSGQASNRIHGRITMGSDVLAMIDGHWDQEIYIKDRALDKKKDVFWNPTPDIRVGRLKRCTVPIADQQSFESERLWERVSKAVVAGDMQAATNEKYIIEEEQRKQARERKQSNLEWVPRFFEKDYHGGGDWIYKYADDRPWDPVNDVYQYEIGFVVQTQTRHKTPHLRATSLNSLNKTVEKKKLRIPRTVEESDSSGHGIHPESDSSDYIGPRAASGKVVKVTQDGMTLLFEPLVKMQEETTHALRSLQQQVMRLEMQQANDAGGGGGLSLLSKDWVTLAIILIFQIILQWIFR